MLKLNVIITSTRPGRKGPAIAEAFMPVIRGHAAFNSELVDLETFHLPVFDEPAHPRLRQYVHEHTKKWSASVDSADAFIFVLPEYNFGVPGSVKNMLDFVSFEWTYKPLGFISYGGLSAGLRSVDAVLPTARALKLVAVPEGVHIPMFAKHFDEDGKFQVDDGMKAAANGMLNELEKWGNALKPLRG